MNEIKPNQHDSKVNPGYIIYTDSYVNVFKGEFIVKYGI